MFAVHVIAFKHRSETLANMPGLPSLVQSWVSLLRDGVGGLGSVHLSFQCSAEDKDKVTFCCIDILLLSPKTSDFHNLLHTVRKYHAFRIPATF